MMEGKKAQTELRLIIGIFVIMFGAIGIGSLGFGIAINNNMLSWFGGVVTSAVLTIIAIIMRFIE